MIALIDGDILLYKVGYSCEHTYYNISLGDSSIMCGSYVEALEWAEPEHIFPVSHIENWDYCKRMFEDIVQWITTNALCHDYTIYLSGSNNFRLDVSSEYKATRSASKPYHYYNLLSHIQNNHPYIMTDTDEADDKMGIDQTDDTVICSIDKDMWMIPGQHYDFSKDNIWESDDSDEIYFKEDSRWESQDPGEIYLNVNNKVVGHGFLWFCQQMLMGDAVDNIKGIRQIGPKKALNHLYGCDSVEEAWSVVKSMYKYYNMEDQLETNAVLLWIKREEGQHPYDFIYNHNTGG